MNPDPGDATSPDSLAALVNVVPFGLLVFDDNGVILDLNDTLLTWLETSRESLVGERIDCVFPPGGRIFYQTHLFPLLRASGSVTELYFALRSQAGKELPVLLNVNRQMTGESVRNIAAFVVINNRQQFEGALIQAMHTEQEARAQIEATSQKLDAAIAELTRSNEAKDEFIGLVSHELKNPLIGLRGTFEVLVRTFEQGSVEEGKPLVAELHAEFVRLLTVLENLLVIARSDMAGVEVEPVRVPRVAERMVARHALLHPARQFIVETAPGTPLALASQALTEQIADNFLSNALKYGTPELPIEVHIGHANERVTLMVANAGEPLTVEEVGRFFQPFYRGLRDRQRAPGVGLGLTVCQRLAEAQSGDISARPRTVGGLEITLSLPALRDDELDNEVT